MRSGVGSCIRFNASSDQVEPSELERSFLTYSTKGDSMQNQNRSAFFVPPHPDVPEETHHTVLTHLTAEHQAKAKRLIKRSQRVAAVNASLSPSNESPVTSR